METGKLFGWKKTIHLCRGLPGSGKSTLALKLVNGNRHQVVENDDYWFVPLDKMANTTAYPDHFGPYVHKMVREGNFTYQYVPRMTSLAGWWCYAEAFRRLRIFDEVAVANTFVKWSYVEGFVQMAKDLGVRIVLHEPSTPWAKNVNACDQKNVHDVPLDVIERMKAGWEEITQHRVNVALGLEEMTDEDRRSVYDDPSE